MVSLVTAKTKNRYFMQVLDVVLVLRIDMGLMNLRVI